MVVGMSKKAMIALTIKSWFLFFMVCILPLYFEGDFNRILCN
jgi:hypothetical protein